MGGELLASSVLVRLKIIKLHTHTHTRAKKGAKTPQYSQRVSFGFPVLVCQLFLFCGVHHGPPLPLFLPVCVCVCNLIIFNRTSTLEARSSPPILEVPVRSWKFPIKASSSQSKAQFPSEAGSSHSKLEVPNRRANFDGELRAWKGNFQLRRGIGPSTGNYWLWLGTTSFLWELPVSGGNFHLRAC